MLDEEDIGHPFELARIRGLVALFGMSLPAPLFLAARYLKPKRTFLAVITLISVIGVTLGITVLILVMSVMTGFERELQRKVIGFDAHLLISNNGLMDDWQGVAAKIATRSPAGG